MLWGGSFGAGTGFLGGVGAIQGPLVPGSAESGPEVHEGVVEITIAALGEFGTLILHGNKIIYGSSSKVLRVARDVMGK